MTDDQLADAWESFAAALHDAPARIAHKRRASEEHEAERQKTLLWQYRNMQGAPLSTYSRGYGGGLYGLGSIFM